MSEERHGTSLDDFLKEEGFFEEAQEQAIHEVTAWQLDETLEEESRTTLPRE